MVRYAVLGSGSSGNSYVFSDGSTSVLIDQGYSGVELQRRLAAIGLDVSSVAAVCVTHLHPDHAKGLGVIARKLRVPVYLHTEMVEKESVVFSKLCIPQECIALVRPLESFSVGPFVLSCFVTSHDSGGSVGWRVTYENTTMMVLTDTGCYTQEQLLLAKSSNILFLEANYDEVMLQEGPYPYYLKQRISGLHGHLSNGQAMQFLQESGFNGEHVYFIHLSGTNNAPSLLSDMARVQMRIPFTVCEKGQCYGGNLEKS
ncbi:MAG: MBL fold metallo-hydrolase [Spirochaetia bacterium]|nr:MBL fold metallo-hydrolase [Spirochaetia bacterium]